MFKSICAVGRCTAKPPGPEQTFLFKDEPLDFAQLCAFCKVAESFWTSWWPDDNFPCLIWKFFLGQQDPRKSSGFNYIWQALLATLQCQRRSYEISKESLTKWKPTMLSKISLSVCGRIFGDLKPTYCGANRLDGCGSLIHSPWTCSVARNPGLYGTQDEKDYLGFCI